MIISILKKLKSSKVKNELKDKEKNGDYPEKYELHATFNYHHILYVHQATTCNTVISNHLLLFNEDGMSYIFTLLSNITLKKRFKEFLLPS